MPTLQADVFDEAGRWVGRCDFLWERFGVVGEADGLTKYTDVSVLGAEKMRQERLERTGLTVVRWTASDLRDRNQFSMLIRRALDRGLGGDRRARWAWRPH